MSTDIINIRKAASAFTYYSGRGHLPMFTIYGKNTKDYPGWFVARLFISLPTVLATPVVLYADTLQGIRDALPQCGLSRMERDPNDDPVILEIWL